MSAVIRSPRLDLVLLSPELMDALILGDKEAAQMISQARLPHGIFPVTPKDSDFFRMRRDQVQNDATWAPWSLRAVVLRDEDIVIGTANFHGPPGVNDTSTPGAVEVGYEILPAYRRAGFGTEVALSMLTWANRVYGITHFISGVAPDNVPSLRLNEKIGFVPTGNVVDGEVIFELRLGYREDLWARG
jgi:ribosomal-protein-alanine N-acetyltransferase